MGHVNRGTGFRMREVKTLFCLIWVKLDLESGVQGRCYNMRIIANWRMSFSSNVRMDFAEVQAL